MLSNFIDMSIYQIIVWFFIYSFFGWCMECVVIRVQLKRWENRGFAKLPFCIIYGFGIMGALTVFEPFSNNIFLLYLAGCIGGTAFEYLVAMVMIKLFGELWWNYDHKRFNYKGILCLQSTLAWGAICVLMYKVVNVYVKKFVMAIDKRVVMVLAIVLATSYTIDFIHQFYVSVNAKKNKGNVVKVEGKSEINDNIN